MKIKQILTIIALTLFSSALYANAATATGAGTLPWEAPLTLIVASMTGPVAYALSVIGIVVAMGIILFGNDLNQFGRTIVYLVMVIAIIVASANVLAGLFTTGSTIGIGTVIGSITTTLLIISSLITTLEVGIYRLFISLRRANDASNRLATA